MYNAFAKELNKTEILKRVSEWDLWSYYIPGVKLGGSFLSPLRNEKNPSASLFVSKSGNILLKEFNLGTFTIWRFLQTKYNLTFYECLLTINNDFNLGISSQRNNKPTMLYFGIEQKEHTKQKSEFTNISIKKRSWNSFDKNYWLGYNLSLDYIESRVNKVLPLANFWINEELSYWHYEYNPCYSYEFGINYDKKVLRKLYLPYNKLRFITNCTNDVFQGEDDLPHFGTLLIITKSYKDSLVLSNLGYCSVSPQGESALLNKQKINSYKKRFDTIYLLFDNDEVGKKWSNLNCETYNLKQIFIPTDSNCKDISDYIFKYKLNKTNKLIESWINN
jgi:hypothetical protein